jgi:DNA polymerase
MPEDMQNAIDEGCTFVFHNGGQFDRVVFARNKQLAGYADALADASRLHDTMVQALAHSLPGSLDALCDLYKLSPDKAKVKDSRALVLFFCKPHNGVRHTRLTHPEKWTAFVDYAKHDVEAMRVLYHKMPKWNYRGFERDLWILDQKINDRGLLIDMDFVEKVVGVVDVEKKRLAKRTQEETAGSVDADTQRDRMLKYLLDEYGIDDLPDMKKATLQRLLDDDNTPSHVRLLLELRLQSTTVSTAKYKTLLRSVSSDGRLRGTLQFCGANRTGRWSGRRFQPHNFARPDMDNDHILETISAIKRGIDVSLTTDNVMSAASNALRGSITARSQENAQ